MADKIREDLASERVVLSGIFRHGKEALLDIADLIAITDFTQTNNQIIFKCIGEVLENSDTVDIPALLAASASLGLYDVVNTKDELEYISSLEVFPTSIESVRPHAVKLKKLGIARLIQARVRDAFTSMNEVTGDESIDEIISLAESPIFDISNDINKQSDERTVRIFADGIEYLDHLRENKTDQIGIGTGFDIYDEAVGGGQRGGSVNLVVARPKTGKTTMAKEVALYVAEDEIPVLMLDTEMSKDDQVNRSVASGANILTGSIETGKFDENPEAVRKAYEWMQKAKDLPYYYRSVAGKPFEEILSIIRRWLFQDVGIDDNGNVKPCLVIYDYFKLMDESSLDKMQEYQAMGFQISKMTDCANQYGFSCLAFVQANRDGITKESSDIVSQSDRLLWACGSLFLLREKTDEEQIADGVANGNLKLVHIDCRYGPGLDGDYINIFRDGNYSVMKELTTQKQALKAQAVVEVGYETEDATLEEVPFD